MQVGVFDYTTLFHHESRRWFSHRGEFRISYLDLGSGDPLVLLHGFGGSVYTWNGVVDELAKHHRVIVVDLKGFGDSDKPDDGQYSLLDQTEIVTGLIRELDLTEATLVGHSMGGTIALLTTLDLMDNGDNRVSKLVLFDSPAYEQPLPAFIRVLRAPVIGSVVPYLLSPRFSVRSVLESCYYNDELITEEEVATYVKALESSGGRKALVSTARQMLPANGDDLTGRYGEITLPTLVVWGEDDRIVPLATGRRLDEALKNSSLQVLERCGHIPFREKRDRTLELISAFLAND